MCKLVECQVMRPNGQLSAAPLAASEGWRTAAGGSCQAMRVRPTRAAPGAWGKCDDLEVAGCRDARRPERFAG